VGQKLRLSNGSPASFKGVEVLLTLMAEAKAAAAGGVPQTAVALPQRSGRLSHGSGSSATHV